MSDFFNNAISQMRLLLEILDLEGATVIDATAGNGKDTLFLAQAVGDTGRVFSFDIQQQAITKTQELLDQHHITWCNLIKDSHENIDKYEINAPLAIVFNLGYLPGGDHNIITQPHSTVTAVSKAMRMLQVGGILTVVIYTGHEGGKTEENTLLNYLRALPRAFDVLEMSFLNRSICSPYLIAVRKTKEVHDEI